MSLVGTWIPHSLQIDREAVCALDFARLLDVPVHKASSATPERLARALPTPLAAPQVRDSLRVVLPVAQTKINDLMTTRPKQTLATQQERTQKAREKHALVVAEFFARIVGDRPLDAVREAHQLQSKRMKNDTCTESNCQQGTPRTHFSQQDGSLPQL